MRSLPAFSDKEAKLVKVLLATQVASMMGRKFEEGDWTKVYCRAKGIPEAAWSNLHIDVIHNGLGLEMKLLRIGSLSGRPLKAVCGTTQMHPAATRSIRVPNVRRPANEVMKAVFQQYAELVDQRRARVQAEFPRARADMRTGWLIWESELTEFLYFEERMVAPNPDEYFAEWNATPARGVRKASKSLWVYDRKTKQKRYSITTSAGPKIQPYFDVPPPSDPGLYYFRVQSEPLGEDTIQLWVSAPTARALESRLGSLEREVVSDAILRVLKQSSLPDLVLQSDADEAVPVRVSTTAYARLREAWDAVSDEHRAQLLLRALAG